MAYRQQWLIAASYAHGSIKAMTVDTTETENINETELLKHASKKSKNSISGDRENIVFEIGGVESIPEKH